VQNWTAAKAQVKSRYPGASKMTDPAADHQAAAAAEYRTKPAALIVKPYAVDHLNSKGRGGASNQTSAHAAAMRAV